MELIAELFVAVLASAGILTVVMKRRNRTRTHVASVSRQWLVDFQERERP